MDTKNHVLLKATFTLTYVHVTKVCVIVIYLNRILKRHVPKIIARIFITPPSHIWAWEKLLTDLNRNTAQVQSSRWNYHYSTGTASVVLELPRLKILHFLSNEERLVNIFLYRNYLWGPSLPLLSGKVFIVNGDWQRDVNFLRIDK